MRRMVLMLAVLALLVPAAAQATPILVHDSRERFHFNLDTWGSGTSVVGCTTQDPNTPGMGCPAINFAFGDTSGTIYWEVSEKVWMQEPGLFLFTYTVFNDLVAEFMDYFGFENQVITSFFVYANGIQPIEVTSPPGWAFEVTEDGYWHWYCAEENWQDCFTAPEPGSFNSMSALVHTSGVGFAETGFNTQDWDWISADAWYASSPVPEPATLGLFGTGLIGLAGLLRRKLTS